MLPTDAQRKHAPQRTASAATRSCGTDLRNRHLQPLLQSLASLCGQRIHIPVRASLLTLRLLLHQPRCRQPLQSRIDLSITLAPEVSDRLAASSCRMSYPDIGPRLSSPSKAFGVAVPLSPDHSNSSSRLSYLYRYNVQNLAVFCEPFPVRTPSAQDKRHTQPLIRPLCTTSSPKTPTAAELLPQ